MPDLLSLGRDSDVIAVVGASLFTFFGYKRGCSLARYTFLLCLRLTQQLKDIREHCEPPLICGWIWKGLTLSPAAHHGLLGYTIRIVPANLTPQYREAEQLLRQARSAQDKAAALEEMLRVIPKHKGTEKLQADLKKRLSKLTKKATAASPRSGYRPFHQIDREGTGRVVVCGPPNSGKSELVDRLTTARPEVADYGFTTRRPLSGMMEFEDIQVQLIDTPPLDPVTLESWMLQLIKQSDVVLLVFDVNDLELLEQTDFILSLFSDKGVLSAGGPRLVVLTSKMDVPGADESLEVWEDLFSEQIHHQPFTSRNPAVVEKLRRKLFRCLDVVRFYTKRPGHSVEPGSEPFLLKKGATVIEAAGCVHKDFARNFRFARIWRSQNREGQMIDQHEEVKDGDLLEIHTF